ncbi:MAG TPA: purine-nucleoside phosphorylase [Chthoniobacterales bacterium]|nr:purine-nucleoside phosphorylase [Chthoniobacterales bacterium]
MHNAEGESALRQLRDWKAEIAVVLGSGLNALVAEASPESIIRYTRFPQLPSITVPGHVGQFVLSQIGERRVIFSQGRIHLYEGRSAAEVTAIVRLLADVGIKILILTNAAGSLNPSLQPGQWMMIEDHINLTGTSPLTGAPTFIDMTETYSPRLRQVFAIIAAKEKTVLHEGVYIGLLGPQYETPAEVRMLRSLGGDAVGMSTVLEAIQARTLGMELAGFSCLTNFAAGISPTSLSHEEVLETGRGAADTFVRLLSAALPQL